jgi:hypothetical protein
LRLAGLDAFIKITWAKDSRADIAHSTLTDFSDAWLGNAETIRPGGQAVRLPQEAEL